MEKILIFTTRQLCYNSANYFANVLACEFEQLGYECEMCEIDEGAIPSAGTEIAQPVLVNAGKRVSEDAETALERYIGKKYLAVIDFNSKLPRLVMDDDSYYLDNIDAPFFNFILDHPLYHHSTLECRLKRYNVFSVDEKHCEYIRKYYKHIKSVNQVLLGATSVLGYLKDKKHERTDLFNKEKCILFMGTYRNPDTYLEYINKDNPFSSQDMILMIDKMKCNPYMTIEEALISSLEENERNLPISNSFVLNSYYLVEAYIRNYRREKLIEQLCRLGYPVKVVGDWWDRYPHLTEYKIEWVQPVSFEDSYDEIAKCRILADSSPFFTNGIHDRVFAGMANFTEVLTDYNEYRDIELGENVSLYRYEDSDEIQKERVGTFLEDDVHFLKSVENAFDEFENKYSWKCVANRIINYFSLSE